MEGKPIYKITRWTFNSVAKFFKMIAYLVLAAPSIQSLAAATDF